MDRQAKRTTGPNWFEIFKVFLVLVRSEASKNTLMFFLKREKGLLALEGELAPILVQMVKSANTNGLLDNESDELHEFAGE